MLRVGLTGGIGSGKSVVAGIFDVLGVPVYNADREAKRLMNSDPEIRQKIIAAFGIESYKGTEINRSFLISHVFYIKDRLNQLNAIVHPATISDAQRWMAKQSAPYAIKEAAIIFETGTEKFLDFVIGVAAPEKIRIMRVMKRDDRTEQEVRKWMATQMDEEEKISRCDFVISNDGKKMLIPQVLAIHRKLLEINSLRLQ